MEEWAGAFKEEKAVRPGHLGPGGYLGISIGLGTASPLARVKKAVKSHTPAGQEYERNAHLRTRFQKHR